MKILLDENFPLPLHRRLREAGYDAEHVTALGKRGMPDAELRRRLAAEPILLLTNDTEFEDIGLDYAGKVVISRLPQRLPTSERVEIRFKALPLPGARVAAQAVRPAARRADRCLGNSRIRARSRKSGERRLRFEIRGQTPADICRANAAGGWTALRRSAGLLPGEASGEETHLGPSRRNPAGTGSAPRTVPRTRAAGASAGSAQAQERDLIEISRFIGIL